MRQKYKLLLWKQLVYKIDCTYLINSYTKIGKRKIQHWKSSDVNLQHILYDKDTKSQMLFKRIWNVLFPVLTNITQKWNKFQSHWIGRERLIIMLGMSAWYLLSWVILTLSPGSVALPGPVGMLTKSNNQAWDLRISGLGRVMSVRICMSVPISPHKK